MGNAIKTILAFGLGFFVYQAGGISDRMNKSKADEVVKYSTSSELDSKLMQAASELNKNLPIMVDADTRLDSAIGSGGKFRYNYTLVNFAVEDIEKNQFLEVMKPNLLNLVCTTEDMKNFIVNNVTVSYAYYGKNRKHLTTIPIKPSDCK